MKKTLAIGLAALLAAGSMTMAATAADNSLYTTIDIDLGVWQEDTAAGTGGQALRKVEGKEYTTRQDKIYWYHAEGTADLREFVKETSATVATTSGSRVVSANFYPSESYEVIELVNAERAKVGAAPLMFDPDLAEAALQRSMETTLGWSHVRPDGSQWYTVCPTANGENIAKGSLYKTSNAVMNGWMDSPGHKANILKEDFTRIGVAAVKIGDTVYWVQLFGN